MASKHDIGWEHAEPVGGSRRTTKCKYCGKVIHGGITRLKQHIAHISGQVEGCPRVPVEVSHSVRQHGDSDDEIEEVAMADFERRQMKQAMKESRRILKKVDKSITDSGPYYQSMIDTIAEAGPGIKVPRDTKLEIHIWKRRCKNLRTRKPIINFMIYCDRKEVGEENVVQVVTDNEASFKAAGMLLMEKRKHLFWSPYAAHCIDLMLEDIGSMKRIKETLDQAKMITGFIYNSLKVVNLMKVFTKDRDLLRLGITRFATEFISLESFIHYEADLKECAQQMSGVNSIKIGAEKV
ncbi:hypothetical protein CK203_048615 [Vitis vinifera]|uniref:BED-type domain-containing protein n=1 Tax=Vitis vinifera TaxID=29760 RepID=A0A438HK45_VITVI|nr:hypothetical protein CK203_048615 [Vitis vinifera]